MKSLFGVRSNNDQFPLLNGVQLLNRWFLVKDDFVVTYKMNDDFGIGWQPVKIKVIEEYNIQLIVVPNFLMNERIKIYDRSSHRKSLQTNITTRLPVVK